MVEFRGFLSLWQITIKSSKLVLNIGAERPSVFLDGIYSNYIPGIRYLYSQISQPVTAFAVPIINAFVLLISYVQ